MGITLKAEMEGNKNELLCAFSALMLADGEQEVTADNINAAIKAAGGSVPAYYAQLFEKIHGLRPVSEIVADAGKVGSGAPAAGAAPAAAAAGGDAAPAKKESSSDDDDAGAPGGGLFGDDGDDY